MIKKKVDSVTWSDKQKEQSRLNDFLETKWGAQKHD